jgi:phosphate:Na+ symporter
MGGLAEQLHPADLLAVLPDSGVGWWSALLGLLTLVVVGLVMTAVMQSSTASIALTLSANYAGAIGLDQACALIIGQNIGTATSSAMAAIGASVTAKRLAIAYVLFKLIAALIALVLFPFVTPLLVRASTTIDGVTLLAAYHTAYNVVGVVVLLPLIDKFTRFVERLLPERGSPLTRCLDPSVLVTPIAAVEAVRRTIARSLGAMCGSLGAALAAAGHGGAHDQSNDAESVAAATDALRQAEEFISGISGAPQSEDERQRLTNTLHALDHTSRLAEAASEKTKFETVNTGPEDACAAQLCVDAMQSAASVAAEVGALPAAPRPSQIDNTHDVPASSIEEALVRLERSAKTLGELQGAYRSATLGAVAKGTLTANEAIIRVDNMRRLEALAHHVWRAATHLIGRNP